MSETSPGYGTAPEPDALDAAMRRLRLYSTRQRYPQHSSYRADVDMVCAALIELRTARAERERLAEALGWALETIERGTYPAIDFSGESGYFAAAKRLLDPEWGKRGTEEERNG